MLKPNELMTWAEVVKKYPGKWVFVEVVEGNVAKIKKGIVRAVVEDGHLADGKKYCISQGWKCVSKRTTYAPFMGIVDGVNFRIDVEEDIEGEL